MDFDDLISYTPEQKRLELSQIQREELQRIAQIGLERAAELKIETTLEQYLSSNIRIRGQDAPSTITPVSHKNGLDGAPCLNCPII